MLISFLSQLKSHAMKNRFSLFLLLFPFVLFSQSIFLDFKDVISGPCPFDPSVNITQLEDWRIYQTEDDTWDGIVSQNSCFEVQESGDLAIFPLDQIEAEKTLFIRAIFPPEEVIPDAFNGIQALVNPPFGTPELNLNVDCNNSICSGILVGVEVPDASGTGTELRMYPINAEMIDGEFDLLSCFATESIGGVVKEIIVKLSFEDPDISNTVLLLNQVNLIADFTYVPLEEDILLPPDLFDGQAYNFGILDIVDNTFSSFLMFKYHEPTYPSSQNPSFFEVRPEPNTETPQTINFTIEESFGVVFQPFTQIRGDTVVGDSLRHTFNLIDNGSEFCFVFVIELIFEDNANFIYNSGHLEFKNPKACMMFRRNSHLILGDGAELNYGQNGAGMLAIYPDGGIDFGKNASLNIDGKFLLMGYPDRPKEELHIELRPGQSLTFGESASLSYPSWGAVPVHLNVHMLGGTLDDSNLSAEERQLIRRIYPATSDDFSENINLYPNPNHGAFNLEVNLPEAGNVQSEIFDVNGKLVSMREENFPKGISIWEIDEPLSSGVYFVKISSGGNSSVEKILVR